MKNKFVLLFFMIFSLFVIMPVVNAAKYPNACIYQGTYNGQVGFTTATIDQSNKVHIDKLDVRDENHGFLWTGLFSSKKLEGVNHYVGDIADMENFNRNASVAYKDDSGNKQTMDLKQFRINPGIQECPQYMMLLNSGYGWVHDFYVVAGGDDLKSAMESTIPNNEYTTLTYGTLLDASSLIDPDDPTDPNNPGGGDDPEQPDPGTCEGLLGSLDADGNYASDTFGWLLQKVFDYIKLAAIVLIFAFSAVDFAKAIIDQNQDLLKSSTQKLGKRLIFGIIVFLLPVIIDLILKVIDSSTCGLK